MAALIKDLQAQILELQHELPEGSLQTELQRLQNLLSDLTKQPAPVTPTALIVQPAAEAVPLTARELAVLGTFTRFVKALSRVSVERLAEVASNLTVATYLSPEDD